MWPNKMMSSTCLHKRSLLVQPVIINSTAFSGPFKDGCRECVCENGKVTCNSPECPDVALTCVDPEMGEDCCPFCPNGKILSRPNEKISVLGNRSESFR